MLRRCSILRMFPTGRPNPFIFEYWLRATVTPYCRRGKQSRHGMKRPERLCERRQCGVWMWIWWWMWMWMWMLLTGFIGLPDPALVCVAKAEYRDDRAVGFFAVLRSEVPGRLCVRCARFRAVCAVDTQAVSVDVVELGAAYLRKRANPCFAEKTKIRFGIFRYRVVRCRSCMAETVGLRDISRRRCSVRGSCAGVYG